jgi:hypothetical protein
MRRRVLSMSAILAVLLLVVTGCGQGDSKGTGQAKAKDTGSVAKAEPKAEGKHEGWWCDEHGIPESECSLCSAKVAKEFKAKGDWCEKHDRAKSQCFICDPKLKEKYASQYRAKYGKEPPQPADDEKSK